MRHFILSALCVLLTGCASDPGQPADPAAPLLADLHDPDGRVMVAAHRGCWSDGNAPENSVAAMQACIRLGVDIVELDLRFTSDGALVLSHDSTLKRMAGVDRKIADLTLAEVQSHPLRNHDGRSDGDGFTTQHLASFREMLQASGRHVLIIMDLKDDPAKVAPAAARILREEGDCDIAMFALPLAPDEVEPAVGPLLSCAAFLPNLRVPMGPMSTVARSYAKLDPVAVAVRFDDWSYLYEGADAVAAMPARLWVNTLNPYHAGGLTDADALTDPDALWGRLVDAGVNMIQTDEPAALMAYLQTHKARATAPKP